MAERRDRVLIVARDARERAALVEAALEPAGYAVDAAGDGGSALARVRADPPDVLILDLHLDDLSGRDVLAALNAQQVNIPVILLADEGSEREALRAFRLGAKDYVLRPVREAELIQAVERALEEVRLRREREALHQELRTAARHLERTVGGLRTLMAIGKAITSTYALDRILQAVVRAAVEVTGADMSGFFMRDDPAGPPVLRAGYRLPGSLVTRLGQPVEDELAALVMSSRETFLASGGGLQRFSPAYPDASAVIYAPLVVNEAAVGLLWVVNERAAFKPYMKDLMTALADYAAIAVVNARLFSAAQERAQEVAPPVPELAADDQRCAEMAAKLRAPLIDVLNTMNMFRVGQMGPLKQSHRAAMDVLHRKLGDVLDQVDAMSAPSTGRPHSTQQRRER